MGVGTLNQSTSQVPADELLVKRSLISDCPCSMPDSADFLPPAPTSDERPKTLGRIPSIFYYKNAIFGPRYLGQLLADFLYVRLELKLSMHSFDDILFKNFENCLFKKIKVCLGCTEGRLLWQAVFTLLD